MPPPVSHALLALSVGILSALFPQVSMAADPGVAVLFVDTDRVEGHVDERIYGQFLEHINHSVEDGLYAEQIRGQGFEGKDFADYWEIIGDQVELADEKFEKGEKSVRLSPVMDKTNGIRQGRIYLQAKTTYDGSLWVNPERGSLELALVAKDSTGKELARVSLPIKPNAGAAAGGWQEIPFKFESPVTDPQASIEILATGKGGGAGALIDFPSLMPADARKNGKFRPDLLNALKDLHPAFIRWPGGSFASTYKWDDGIGPAVSRKFTPNVMWGGYSDYFGFGTEEFLDLCQRLGSEPLICLAATSTKQDEFDYAMNWVHYLLDPASTDWGQRRAANGHPAPYKIPYLQIDNEPMNHNLTPDQYAAIVNLYGKELRKIAPNSKIVACGQKRSNDMNWSEKMIDIAGDNFDILGCHNYEYEPDNYATGVRRIEEYLRKASDYIRTSKHPNIQLAVLEWSSARTYDWRSGLHSAGSLIAYEKLSPTLTLTCPALLMRNTTDNPEWRAWIYHDHVSWFAGSGYVAEKLFRDHYAPLRYASTHGTFNDIPKRADFFDGISQMKPEAWIPNTVDAVATGTPDGKRIILKAVNYTPTPQTLLTRLQGAKAPAQARVTVTTIAAGLQDANSLTEPNKLKPTDSTIPYTRELMAIPLPPYGVVVTEITTP
jgi:alpha-L-arabinofuranosidase